MKTRAFLAALSLAFLASCAQISPHGSAHHPAIDNAIQNARTPGDHYALTSYFEGTAREMRVKAAEQKKLLEHYENKSYLYGREAQDLISHASALVRMYSQTATNSIKEAALHRRMAQGETIGNQPDRKMADSSLIEVEKGSN